MRALEIACSLANLYPGKHSPSSEFFPESLYIPAKVLKGGRPKVVAYLYGGQGSMNVPSWSPDGKKVAFVSNSVPF